MCFLVKESGAKWGAQFSYKAIKVVLFAYKNKMFADLRCHSVVFGGLFRWLCRKWRWW